MENIFKDLVRSFEVHFKIGKIFTPANAMESYFYVIVLFSAEIWSLLKMPYQAIHQYKQKQTWPSRKSIVFIITTIFNNPVHHHTTNYAWKMSQHRRAFSSFIRVFRYGLGTFVYCDSARSVARRAHGRQVTWTGILTNSSRCVDFFFSWFE